VKKIKEAFCNGLNKFNFYSEIPVYHYHQEGLCLAALLLGEEKMNHSTFR
jgi:hypothetical protein